MSPFIRHCYKYLLGKYLKGFFLIVFGTIHLWWALINTKISIVCVCEKACLCV